MSLTALSFLFYPLSISSSNKSLTKALYQQDDKACNRENWVGVGFFVKGGKDWTGVGFFAGVWLTDVEMAFFVYRVAIIC